MKVEQLIEMQVEEIDTAFRAGCQNFQGYPFTVWLLDCDDPQAQSIARALSAAGRHKALMKGDFEALPDVDQMDVWMKACRDAGSPPIMTAPMIVDKSVKLAYAINRRVFAQLRAEPSDSEFWVVVVSGGGTTLARHEKPTSVIA